MFMGKACSIMDKVIYFALCFELTIENIDKGY